MEFWTPMKLQGLINNNSICIAVRNEVSLHSSGKKHSFVDICMTKLLTRHFLAIMFLDTFLIEKHFLKRNNYEIVLTQIYLKIDKVEL